MKPKFDEHLELPQGSATKYINNKKNLTKIRSENLKILCGLFKHWHTYQLERIIASTTSDNTDIIKWSNRHVHLGIIQYLTSIGVEPKLAYKVKPLSQRTMYDYANGKSVV